MQATHYVPKARHPINPSQATKLRSVGHTTTHNNPACQRHDTRTSTTAQIQDIKKYRQHTMCRRHNILLTPHKQRSCAVWGTPQHITIRVPKARYPHEHDSANPKHKEVQATHYVPKARHPINPSQATKLRSVGHTTTHNNPACQRHDIRTSTTAQIHDIKKCRQHTMCRRHNILLTPHKQRSCAVWGTR